jgi:hypothetical protein
MRQKCYIEIEAADYQEMGRKLGAMFGEDFVRPALEELNENYPTRRRRYEKHFRSILEQAEKEIPYVIQELTGYAEGAKVNLEDMVWLAVGEEPGRPEELRCTTVITNDGMLIGHNEDYSEDAAEYLYALKKTIGDLTILELHYAGGLGGDSISINSHGYVHTVNTLTHSDFQRDGAPRSFIARRMSETKNPKEDHDRIFNSMRRRHGYSHNIVSPRGRIFNIESSATQSTIKETSGSFCHTNHFLDEDLKSFECDDDASGTSERYKRAKDLLSDRMDVWEMKELLSDREGGPICGLFNNNTIASVVVDLKPPNRRAYIRLRRKDCRDHNGWETYDLDFIESSMKRPCSAAPRV